MSEPSDHREVGSTAGHGDGVWRRLGTMGGDRPCTGCSYNLVGQPIMREPRYELVVVRCPECGTLASLQEYPVLARSAWRWAGLLAAVWILGLLALTAGTLGLLVGFVTELGDTACSSVSTTLSNHFQAWVQEQQQDPGATNVWQLNVVEQGDFARRWNQVHGGVDGFIASKGGVVAIVNWWSAAMILPGLGLAWAAGVVWSVALLGGSRRRLWLAGAIQSLLAGALLVHFFMTAAAWRTQMGGAAPWWVMLTEYSETHVRPAFSVAGWLALSTALLVGMLTGRSVARWLVTIFLPPRLRWALTPLWTADGLSPPRTEPPRPAAPTIDGVKG